MAFGKPDRSVVITLIFSGAVGSIAVLCAGDLWLQIAGWLLLVFGGAGLFLAYGIGAIDFLIHVFRRRK